MTRATAVLLTLAAVTASAQERGFAVQRLDPSAPASRTFLLDRPWYSRYFAAGLTADYGRRVLVPRLATGRDAQPNPIIANQLLGHVELAGALFERVRLAVSLPVAFFENGTPELVSGARPLGGVGVGDPRIGLMVRLFGDAERDGLSLHLGLDAWVPIGAAPTHLGDVGPRVMPRLVAAGAFAGAGRWSAEGAFLYRPYASIGPPALGMTSASEVRLGLAAGASLLDDALYLGPEARFSMQVVGANAARTQGMDLELLAGANVLLGGLFMVGAAAGTSVFSAAGAPDLRAVVRLALAPRRAAEPAAASLPDLDADGVADADDRCPYEPETVNRVRDADGCPEFELNGDAGTALAQVLVRAPPPAAERDAGVNTFFTVDSDGDRVPDESDRCPVTAEDPDGFEDEDGCPEGDNDSDALADGDDRCPNEAETLNGFDDGDGCPDLAPDADADSVADALDRCPLEPENLDGVRDADGCPEYASQPALGKLLAPTEARTIDVVAVRLDSDSDSVDDGVDRCPLTAEDPDGFEDDDGCPERDNDEDGLADRGDQCPLAAETFNGWKDDDGCPDEHGDLDADRVEYERDRCPLEPGDPSDGCPHLPPPALALPSFGFAKAALPATADFDKDGVADEADPCPVTKEDRDGFEDDDGCPEVDNDRDGVDDGKDKCPFAAESINGIKDDDGCPDVGAAVVHVRKGAVVLDETVQFKTASAALLPVSLKLLKQVAAVLKAERALSIEIQGHTDDTGSATTNIKLSQQRAEAIRAALVKAGVAQARLVAKGYGPTRPRASNVSAEGREQNRRVEFLIIGEAK